MGIMMERGLESDGKFFTSRFEANISNLKSAIDDALAFFDESFGQMDEDTRLELKIVLNELLVNAVRHGGKAGSSRYVKAVAGMASEDCAFLIVEDDGEGYDVAFLNKYHEIVAFNGNFDDIQETGRGIYIVKSLCEDFMVNEKGNKVVVIKRLRKSSPL